MNVAASYRCIARSAADSCIRHQREDLAFNAAGACPTCSGTGIMREVDRSALVPDESKSIDEGAVLPWGSLMWDLMKQVCGPWEYVPTYRSTNSPNKNEISCSPAQPSRSTSYTSRKKATISPNSTSRTTTPYTPWRTPSPKPRTKKGLNVLRGSSKSVPAAIAEGPDFPTRPASHISETSIWHRQPRCLWTHSFPG